MNAVKFLAWRSSTLGISATAFGFGAVKFAILSCWQYDGFPAFNCQYFLVGGVSDILVCQAIISGVYFIWTTGKRTGMRKGLETTLAWFPGYDFLAALAELGMCLCEWCLFTGFLISFVASYATERNMADFSYMWFCWRGRLLYLFCNFRHVCWLT